MEVGKVLVSALVFVFVMLLTPTLEDGIAAMNLTAIGSLAPALQAFPLIFVAVAAVFPIWFFWKAKE